MSSEERSKRSGNTLLNVLVWLLLAIGAAASLGILLVIAVLGAIVNLITAEYQVRKVQALGATVSPDQLPEVHQALTRVCDCFGLRKDLRVVVVASGEANALSLRFARKRVVVLLSELLEGVIDDPDALAALLAHEICHSVMDHGIRGFFEVCKSAAYKAARELTCDNAGYLVTRNAAAVKTWLKICCAGKHLHSRLSEPSLIAESLQIERGVTGWLVRSHLSYPPVGKRLRNIDEFASLWEGTGFSPT